jgi:hypothetical protein
MGRKEVLDSLAEALRTRGLLPMMFDFDRAAEKDFTETIMVLAGLSLMVIADITNPKSAPLELHATVPNYMIPFVPIIAEGEQPFSMFQNLQAKYDWVMDVIEYDTIDHLIAGLDPAILDPALEMHDKLVARKARALKSRRITDVLAAGRGSKITSKIPKTGANQTARRRRSSASG